MIFASSRNFYYALSQEDYQTVPETFRELENNDKQTDNLGKIINTYLRKWETNGLIKTKEMPISDTLRELGFLPQIGYIRVSDKELISIAKRLKTAGDVILYSN